MSTEFDKDLRSWSEVTRIWNSQENRNDSVEAIKEAGIKALKKLRIMFEKQGTTFEDLK